MSSCHHRRSLMRASGRDGEGEHARRFDIAEGFQDCQERAFTGTADAPKYLAHGLEAVFKGNDELVLQEARFPIHAVPLVNGVKRIKEGFVC